MPKSGTAISDQLRSAIQSSGVSRYRIWQQTGIDQAILSKFMSGKGGLSIEGIDAIGRLLHLQLVANQPPIATARAEVSAGTVTAPTTKTGKTRRKTK